MTENQTILGGVGLTRAVIAIALLIFIYSAEKIVKHIFHFESQSMADTLAHAAIVGTLLGTVTNGAKKVGAGAGAIKNFANGNKPNGQNPPTPSQANNPPAPSQANNQPAPSQANNSPAPSQANNPPTPSQADNAPQPSTPTPTTDGNKNQFVGNVINGIRNGVNAVSPRIFGAVVAGTLGLATGNPTAMFTSGVAGYGLGAQYARKRDLKQSQREMARAANSYRAAGHEDMSLDDLTNNALEFADGTKEAQTEEEIALRDAMQKLQIQYAKQGLDEKKIIKQAKQTMKDIENGFITEYSAGERFVGKIRQKFAELQRNQQNKDENL